MCLPARQAASGSTVINTLLTEASPGNQEETGGREQGDQRGGVAGSTTCCHTWLQPQLSYPHPKDQTWKSKGNMAFPMEPFLIFISRKTPRPSPCSQKNTKVGQSQVTHMTSDRSHLLRLGFRLDISVDPTLSNGHLLFPIWAASVLRVGLIDSSDWGKDRNKEVRPRQWHFRWGVECLPGCVSLPQKGLSLLTMHTPLVIG